MRVIIAGGGTGGHVYPALAVVEKIRQMRPDSAFLWIGNKDKLESRLAAVSGVEFRPIRVSGFSRKLDAESFARNASAIFLAGRAMRESKNIISEFKPDVIVGTGGYVCGPPVAQAVRMKIPAVLIEPNSYPGMTVRWLAGKVDRIFLGSEAALGSLPEDKCIVTGTPVTQAVTKTTREEGIHKIGLVSGKPCLLVVGGSLGAENINWAVKEFIEIADSEQPQWLESIQIHHQTGGKGPAELDSLRLERPRADYVKVDYIDHMAHALAAADIIVSRAGGATLSEIKAKGLPSILIPYPKSAEDHQMKNARTMVESGASVLIRDNELNGRVLFDNVFHLFHDTEKREKMGNRAKAMLHPECMDVIYNEILQLAIPGDNAA